MNAKTKKKISSTLKTLRQVLIDDGVSIGFDPDDDSLFFFSTDTYYGTGKMKGVTVKIEDLVK